MPKETLERYGKQLGTYLQHFGEINFVQDTKQNAHGFNYVGIELIAKEPIIESLQEEINCRLNNQNGITLRLEFQKWGEQDKNRYRYDARIVSQEPLGEEAYKEHLKTYLPKLRKEIKNATFNHDTCRKKVREIRNQR